MATIDYHQTAQRAADLATIIGGQDAFVQAASHHIRTFNEAAQGRCGWRDDDIMIVQATAFFRVHGLLVEVR